MKALLQQALDALEMRLKQIESICLTTAPKQAVGEMLSAMREMPEWGALRAAIAQPEPTTPTDTEMHVKGWATGHYAALCKRCNKMHDFTDKRSSVCRNCASDLVAKDKAQPDEPEPEPWPNICDGKEQEAWEEWAKSERYDMSQHPLHYLFLNEETAASRKGWKGGLLYAVGSMKKATPYVPLMEDQIRDLAKECGLDWQRGYMPLVDNDPTNRYAVFAEAIERAVSGTV